MVFEALVFGDHEGLGGSVHLARRISLGRLLFRRHDLEAVQRPIGPQSSIGVTGMRRFARPRGYEANTKNYDDQFLMALTCVVVLGVCFIASGPGEAPHSCHTDARLRADWALHSLQIVSSEEKPTQRDTTCEMDRAP